MGDPDALVLTAIGIGTAFGVLVLLLVTVLIIRLISWAIDKYTGNKYTGNGDETPAQPADGPTEPEAGSENRDRARAAAIAVTALIETQPHLSRRDRD